MNFKKKNSCKAACIKIDLHKAFDCINREFIYYLLHCMKFPPKWINWIMECISSPTFSIIMVNCSPEGFFGSNRGIRQGDPISPYILVRAMEFLSIHIELGTEAGKVRPIRKGQENYVSDPLFVADLLVFTKADRGSLTLITSCKL